VYLINDSPRPSCETIVIRVGQPHRLHLVRLICVTWEIKIIKRYRWKRNHVHVRCDKQKIYVSKKQGTYILLNIGSIYQMAAKSAITSIINESYTINADIYTIFFEGKCWFYDGYGIQDTCRLPARYRAPIYTQ